MTCRRSCTSSSEGARPSSSTASGWTPRGTLVFVRPEVKRTAFAEEPGRRSSRSAELRGRRTRPRAASFGCPSIISTSQANTPRLPTGDAELIEAHPEYAGPLYNPRAARASPAGQTMRSSISGSRSTATSRSVLLAAEDSDFDPIRDEAAFKELVQDTAAEPTTG